ncbi:MAG: 60S ribosomal protein L13A [Amphiamblys sp. WSBS2006]|nr:MAG: 60S ribosomal protein L13A [Amphiamblys sp. WSBS2006]
MYQPNETIVIDGKDHAIIKLASAVAKHILSGRNVVVLQCEGILLKEGFKKHKAKFADFLRKRCAYNPKKGPYHHREPSKIFFRKVRTMVPHKTARGEASMERLKTFDGIPAEFSTVSCAIVPEAHRTHAIKRGYVTVELGKVAASFGWKHAEVIKRAGERRSEELEKTAEEKKTQSAAEKNFIQSSSELQKIEESLLSLGYSPEELC